MKYSKKSIEIQWLNDEMLKIWYFLIILILIIWEYIQIKTITRQSMPKTQFNFYYYSYNKMIDSQHLYQRDY